MFEAEDEEVAEKKDEEDGVDDDKGNADDQTVLLQLRMQACPVNHSI